MASKIKGASAVAVKLVAAIITKAIEANMALSEKASKTWICMGDRVFAFNNKPVSVLDAINATLRAHDEREIDNIEAFARANEFPYALRWGRRRDGGVFPKHCVALPGSLTSPEHAVIVKSPKLSYDFSA